MWVFLIETRRSVFLLTVAEIDGIYHLTRVGCNGIAIKKFRAYLETDQFLGFHL